MNGMNVTEWDKNEMNQNECNLSPFLYFLPTHFSNSNRAFYTHFFLILSGAQGGPFDYPTRKDEEQPV